MGEILSLALALAIIVALGLYVSRPNGTLVPTAASPTPAGSTFAPIPTGSASPPAPTATPKTASDHAVVYFARDGAAPVAAAVPGAGIGASAAARIASRIEQLRGADAPPGAINAYPGRGIPIVLGRGAADVAISGDLATIDFTVPGSDWIVRGAGLARALIQQLVFTATEEPGIRRVRITENGGKATVIDQIAVDAPLSREDVNGHEEGSREAVDRVDDGAAPPVPHRAAGERRGGAAERREVDAQRRRMVGRHDAQRVGDRRPHATPLDHDEHDEGDRRTGQGHGL
jgi:hypothetical protein